MKDYEDVCDQITLTLDDDSELLCDVIATFPAKVKDGGSIHYDAILYDIYDVHSLYDLGPDDTEVRYVEGFIIEIFGIQVFNNTNPHINNFGDSPDLEN